MPRNRKKLTPWGVLESQFISEFSEKDFFSEYPHVYFKPKNSNLEIYTSGAVYYSNSLIDVPDDLIVVTAGFNNSSSSWNSLKGLHCFIPQKWVIKTKYGFLHSELNTPCQKLELLKYPSLGPTTSTDFSNLALETIIKECQKGHLDKCVYARLHTEKLSKKFDLEAIKAFPSNGTKFAFIWQKDLVFTGITPEWVYRRKHKKILIDALAGTCPKEHKDQLFTQKLIDEFNYVKTDILQAMKDLAMGSFLDKDTSLVHHNLVHLHNTFTGVLKNDINDLTLIKTLHPTSAISGTPRQLAQNLSVSSESFERGLYGSAIGLYSTQRAYIALAIRCMLISKENVHLFAGAGITKDSDVAEELLELDHKLQLMKKLINNF